MTQINGKAVRAILIVLIALMLVMIYPKQAFASECAENSGSSGSIEVTETDEAGNTPSDCGSGDQGQNTALSDGIDTISTATAPADTNPETDCTVPAQTTGSSDTAYPVETTVTSDTANPVETADTFTDSTPENATSTTDISGSMQDAADPEGNESTHNSEASENTDTKGTTKDTDGTEIIDPAKNAAQAEGKDLTDGAASPENKDTMASDTQKGAPTDPSDINKDGSSLPLASDIEGAPVKPVKPQNTDDEEHYEEDHNTASEPSGGSGIPTPGQEVYPPEEYGLSELNPDVFAQLNTDNNAEAEFEGNILDDASALFIKTGFDNSESADFTGEIGDAPTEKDGNPLSEPAIVVAEDEKEQSEIVAEEGKKQTELSDEDNSIHYIDKIIYGDQKIILTGGESTELSAILSGLGLTGDITDVEVSNPDLLQILNDDGTFYFKSTEPYDTEEWMKVTIDGVEYEIAVLDDAPLADISGSIAQTDYSDTMKFSCSSSYSFNVEGKFKGTYIKTTFNNAGYRTAIQVGEKPKVELTAFKYGKVYETDGVQIRLTAGITDGGGAVALKYEVHNNSSTPVTVKFGSSADTMIGNNDKARVTFTGDTIIMEDDLPSSTTYGARYILYPGDADFTTKWRGKFTDAFNNIFTNLPDETPLTSTDSGIAWSWTAVLEPYQTISRAGELAVLRSGWNVIFNGNGGTPDKSVRVVSNGSRVSPPGSSPSRKGYEFDDWYTEPETIHKFDFSTSITANRNLYAGWEFLPPTVTGPTDLELEYGYDKANKISVTADAAEDASFSYQWYSCNVSGEEAELLPDATAQSYTIPTGKTAGDYYYYCNVSARNSKSETTGPVRSGIANVKVTKKDLTITAGSSDKIYDGTPLTNDTYTYGDDDLVSGDTIDTVSIEGSRTIAGSTPNIAKEAKITRVSDGLDVTDSYNITFTNGSLTVNKRPITITADSAKKIYDGTPLTKDTYTYAADDLASGDAIDTVTIEGSRTIVGTSPNIAKKAKITRVSDGLDVTDSYDITFTNGSLTVNKRPITITADSAKKIYDGTPLTKDTYTYAADDLASGDAIDTVTIEGSRTIVGTSPNIAKKAKITHVSDGLDVTDCYDITFRNGTLTVNKRPITITADSAKKIYDGTPLTKGTYTYAADDLAHGDIIGSITIEGSRTDAGTCPNVAKNARITSSTVRSDVTENYSIKYADGTLTVNKATATVIVPTPNDRIYDGTYKPLVTGGSTDFGSIEYAMKTDESIPSESDYSTEWPDAKYADDYTVWYRVKDTDNYYGKDPSPLNVRISRKEISITSVTDSKIYDGTALTNENYFFDNTTLAEGDTLESGSISVTGSQTNVGSSDNFIHGAVIRCEADDDKDVTASYEITYVNGTLTVTRAEATVVAPDPNNRTYDGTEQPLVTGGSTTFGFIEYAIGEEDTAPDEDAFSNEVPDGKYADDYTVWYRVKDTDDYSGKNPSPINVRINKREITITAATDSKTYDGTALTNGNYILDDASLAECDTLETGSITVTGSQTNVGSSSNHIQGAVIRCEADDMDVTNCYEINYTDGTLTVTKAAMTVSAEGYTGVYDYDEHSIIVEVSAPDEAEIYYSTSELNEDNFREGSTNPVQITDVGTTKVYYYVYSDNYEPDHPSGSADIVIEPRPEPAYMYHHNTDEEDYESYSPPNPDALHAWYLIDDNIVPESKIGKAVQGPLAAAIFARARSFLLNSAFSFDLSIKDKTEYTLKKGKIVMYIPDAFQKKGRVFSVLGLDKNGNIHLFTNVGIHENLLTVNVDFEGYAFELVYTDIV